MFRWLVVVTATLAALVCCPPAAALHLNLTLTTLANGNHQFYHRLLIDALTASGHTVTLTTRDNLPQPRQMLELEAGQISLCWMMQTKERDSKYVLIDHKLTNGLIGKRVLLIPKRDVAVYAGVKDLASFQALGKIAGLGKGWFDVAVWHENGLPVMEKSGEWRQLYSMLASKERGVDYFPRGVTEILAEAKDNPALAIEPNLLLVYPRDFVFYLAPRYAALQPVIEAALKAAEKSGLQKKLIIEYFGSAITDLHLDTRLQLRLKNPA